MAIGQGIKSRRKQDFTGDRRIALGFKDVQFMHEATAGDTGLNLAELTLPSDSGSFLNPNPETIRAANLSAFSPNLELYNGSGRRMALGISFEILGTQITFNNYVASAGEIFFGVIRNVPRTGADFLDGEIKQTTGFLTPGSREFNIGWNFRIGDGSDHLGTLNIHRNRVQQYRNVTGTDADYEEVRAGESEFGTYILFNSPGILLPGGLPELVTVESRQIHIDKETGSLRSEMEAQQGIVYRLANTLHEELDIPLNDLMVPNPTQIQLSQFGDIVFQLRDEIEALSIPIRDTIWVQDANGHGTTNANIRVLGTSPTEDIGNAITYNYSTSLGSSFVINEDGIYAIVYVDRNTSSGARFGVSLNATGLLSTSITAGSLDDYRIAFSDSYSASYADFSNAVAILPLSANDILRPHTNTGPNDTSKLVSMRVTKIGH
jgi:hypothetical protein